MRGEQLARQWRIIRVTEGSSRGLTVAEIPTPEEVQGSGQNGEPFKSPFQKLEWAFFAIGGRWGRA